MISILPAIAECTKIIATTVGTVTGDVTKCVIDVAKVIVSIPK